MTSQPFSAPAVIFVIIGIPLILRLVPPNPIYGVRTADTVADRDVWYRANARMGLGVLLAGTFYLGVACVFPYDALTTPGRFPVHLAAFATPLLLSVVVTRASGRR